MHWIGADEPVKVTDWANWQIEKRRESKKKGVKTRDRARSTVCVCVFVCVILSGLQVNK